MESPATDIVDLEPTSAWRRAMLDRLNQHPFRAAWWLPGSHLQTVWTAMGRKRIKLPFQAERLATPDGDALHIHVLEGAEDKPVLIMLHGLEGSVNSAYAGELGKNLHVADWTVVVMEFRTCSGEMNCAPRTYHLGETTDLAFLVDTLTKRWPDRPFYVAGVSLGGNVVLKWLGEMGGAVPEQVRAAAAMSCPFDVTLSGPHLDRVLGGAYVRWFLRTLIPKALAKAEQFPDMLDVEKIRGSKTFVDYDTHATAKLHGFEDAFDYWKRCSCGQFLPGIRRPTLLLTSKDDPFNPPNTLPHATIEANPFLVAQFSDAGGHMGFVQGPHPLRAEYWAEAQVARFFLACAQEPPPNILGHG
jgi:uncharacterized protein